MVKEWIAGVSYLPLKQQTEMEFGDASSSNGIANGMPGRMSLNVTTNYYDYGKTVVIQLPAAALNATEVRLSEKTE